MREAELLFVKIEAAILAQKAAEKVGDFVGYTVALKVECECLARLVVVWRELLGGLPVN